MKAKRTALFGMLMCLAGAVASGQIAPNNYGDIGLFTMPTADNPRSGQLTLGLYGWKEQLVAGDLPTDPPWQARLYSHWAGEGSLGLGILDNWSVFASAGVERFESRGGWRGGVIQGIQICCRFRDDEARKVRLGTKVNFYADNADPDSLRLAFWLSAMMPTSNATIRQDEQEQIEQLNTRRTDWEWGGVVTKDIWTGMISYQLSGRHDEDVRTANRLRFGLGVDIPIMPFLHVIGELDRNILEGGDYPEEDYSMLTNGVRFWLGRTGLAFSAAVNANLDMLFSDGFSPSPVGGLVGVTYAKWPPLPPPPVVIPPAPIVEERQETVVTVQPPPAPRTTVDEIYFDAGSARLTNIAKAILDGVALRMKNDLNSTATITGYSDNSGAEEANLAVSGRRADSAKEYLVTRHGIDPGRVSTVGRGSADPAFDNSTPEGRAKNRRAVIVVTLTSGA